jgi:hypothetical protein
MRTKNARLAVSLILAVCLASLLVGCRPQYWYLAASKSHDTVQLCLSNESTCPQPGGVSANGISVYRWDNMHDNELVWEAEPNNSETSGRISGLITYGVPPSGWTNKTAPPPLVCGKAYQVNPAADKLFGLKCDGSVVVIDFQHLEYFFRNIDPPDATVKPPSKE